MHESPAPGAARGASHDAARWGSGNAAPQPGPDADADAVLDVDADADVDADLSRSADGGVVVVSFDIDGTLECGDPPGPVAIDVVRAVAAAGHVVGSASDRPRADQVALWARHGVAVAFTGGKHHLPGVRARFAAARYLHIGDTEIDEHFATLARFEFLHCEDVLSLTLAGWLA